MTRAGTAIAISLLAAVAISSLAGGCSRGGSEVAPPSAPVTLGAREFRAIAGVSMGGYGALNIGTKYDHLFSTIGSLGGPVDLEELLRHIVRDNLEVKPQTTLPTQVGDDFTFDHMPPYPDRDSRLSMLRDLVIALGNPWLHHDDPSFRYLASDSEPAQLLIDDEFGDFTLPLNMLGFFDGGDANEDGLRQFAEGPTDTTHVLLVARGSLDDIAGIPPQVVFGERGLAELDGDDIFDVGEGIVINLSEPFGDLNDNGLYDPKVGETFADAGLDGVPGTGDFGEGNGVFDYDPDRAVWATEDPLLRLRNRSAATIAQQNIYMDVGTQDEFGFARHYENLVDLLLAKGLPVHVQDGFSSDCITVPSTSAQFELIRYDGGHIGFADVDTAVDDLLDGDFCEAILIWQRILSLLGFLDSTFPDGLYGPGGLQPFGEVLVSDIPSPALALPGGAAPDRTVVAYRPPAFSNTDESFPVAYFLGGYGQDPEDFVRVGDLMDFLIVTGQVQNMFVVFLPGEGGVRGSFYLNHRVPETQVPGIEPTSGRYEDSIIEDLIPIVEDVLLEGRVRR